MERRYVLFLILGLQVCITALAQKNWSAKDSLWLQRVLSGQEKLKLRSFLRSARSSLRACGPAASRRGPRPEVAPWVRGSTPAPPLARHPEENPMDDAHTPLDEMPPVTAWLSDMDGVLVKENRVLPGAQQFLDALKRKEMLFLVLTNNSIFTNRDLSARLKRSGLSVPEKRI